MALDPTIESSASAAHSENGHVEVAQKRPRSASPARSPKAELDGEKRRRYEERAASTKDYALPIGTPSSYARKAIPGGIQRPSQIASFSYDEHRRQHHDDRSQRFYHAPPHRADLNRGFEALVERDASVNEHLDGLLAALVHLREKSSDPEQVDANRRLAHIITWRGMMTKFCTALYEDRQGFEMNAMMVGDTLYLEEHVGQSKIQERAKQEADPRLRRFGYYGYSFESYTCHSQRDLNPRNDPWDGDVNTNVQWCSIVKTKLGDLRLVIGGEVDAVDPSSNAPIEVKTSMQIRSARDEERFESKMLRFYMQSFLLGVERVVVGFRDHRGTLVTHQGFSTLDMPRLVRGKPHAWDPMASLNFAHAALTAIRKHIHAAMPFDARKPPRDVGEAVETYPVFRISLDMANPSSKTLIVSHLSQEDVAAQVQGSPGKDRVGFLPQSYYEFAVSHLSQGQSQYDYS